MKIDHLAVWVTDLERTRQFYERWFQARAGQRYTNARTGFSSYFLGFEGGSRLELMQRPDVVKGREAGQPSLGYAHLAVELPDPASVDRLTQRMREAGHAIVGEPRTTGDGYYESVVQDPDGHLLELVAAGGGRHG